MTREEALDKVRKMNLPKETMEILEALAPELRESEDERIRKALVEFVHGAATVSNDIDGVSIHDCLAWLEKQKEEEGYEAIPVESTLEYKLGFKAGKDSEKQKERGPLTKEEEYTLHRIIEYLEDETCPSEWINLLHDIYCLPYEKQKEQKIMEQWPNISGCKHDCKHCFAKCLYRKEENDEQKSADLSEMMVHKEPYIAPVPTPMVADEQKPIKPSGKLSRQDYLYQLLIDQLITYSDYEYLIGHKPAEWSDTKEFVFKDICNHLEVEGYSGWVRLLNALRNGEFQPKQEWSEDDELMMKAVIGILGEDDHPKLCSWLKSLKPQSHWRPSEEHLSALLAIFNDPDNIGSQTCQLVLTDLYEQLKKL